MTERIFEMSPEALLAAYPFTSAIDVGQLPLSKQKTTLINAIAIE
jgi:hypothetical protein